MVWDILNYHVNNPLNYCYLHNWFLTAQISMNVNRPTYAMDIVASTFQVLMCVTVKKVIYWPDQEIAVVSRCINYKLLESYTSDRCGIRFVIIKIGFGCLFKWKVTSFFLFTAHPIVLLFHTFSYDSYHVFSMQNQLFDWHQHGCLKILIS